MIQAHRLGKMEDVGARGQVAGDFPKDITG